MSFSSLIIKQCKRLTKRELKKKKTDKCLKTLRLIYGRNINIFIFLFLFNLNEINVGRLFFQANIYIYIVKQAKLFSKNPHTIS